MKLVKEHINEKFTQDSDPIKDMKIGYDENTIEGFLKINGFKKIKIEKDRRGGFNVKFRKNDVKFEFEMIDDDDTASTRHCLTWENVNDSRSFDYQKEKWTLANSDNEEEAVKILKRRLNKYYKKHN